jgi:hypothetical protein
MKNILITAASGGIGLVGNGHSVFVAGLSNQ